MGRFDGSKKQEAFMNALQGKNIPVLTLDNKWYRLLNEVGREEVKPLEEQLNALLKRQGKMNTETKDIRKLKKKLMKDIVAMVDRVEETGDKTLEKNIETNKRLLEECNEKLEAYQDELKDVPREIDRLNKQLMVMTMQQCYETMQENTDSIQEISGWVTQIRIELKKRLIRKQEMEQKNHDIYAYMHDIFGADVVNIFDMRYNPDEHYPKPANKITDIKPENEADDEPSK
ncbi:MAG: hypothetical protein LUG83_04075 [Lachnospiraceae bacterium]|nr:hypothetical protein [Lachnospiraceae bacterium]